MIMNFDVAIIGAGPAGLFAAHTILEHSKSATVLLIDKGKATQDRKCCGNCHVCAEGKRCSILCGIGGSGLFSDGKLVLDLHSGGKLDAISNLSEERQCQLTEHIVRTLKRHDGKSEPSPTITPDEQARWQSLFHAAGLNIKHYDVFHMGTENLHHITSKFADEICRNPRVSSKLNCEIVRVSSGEQGRSILYAENGERFSASHVIFSVGKTGSGWLRNLFETSGIPFKKEPTYLGVRLEVPHSALNALFHYSFDPKIWLYDHGRKIKTHCFCRHGDVVCTNYMGFQVVGGHTRFTRNNGVFYTQQSSKANFNVLVSTTKSSGDVLGVLKQFLRTNPDGAVVQTLSAFLNPAENAGDPPASTGVRGRSGNIRGILDQFDGTGVMIADFILRLARVIPAILDESSLVYGPALEWLMDSVEVDAHMETSHRGWFAVGDGAGLSQGIVHSAATSIIAAEEICRRIM